MLSTKYKSWITITDPKRCRECKGMQGKIFPIDEKVIPEPPLHEKCRCLIKIIGALFAGTATSKGKDGADWWLKFKGRLPDYYIRYDDAIEKGWNPTLGNLHAKCPGKMVFDIHKNKKATLPSAAGRVWYEADINYTHGYRNKERVVFSNDGLIFVTYDHYMTFQEIV